MRTNRCSEMFSRRQKPFWLLLRVVCHETKKAASLEKQFLCRSPSCGNDVLYCNVHEKSFPVLRVLCQTFLCFEGVKKCVSFNSCKQLQVICPCKNHQIQANCVILLQNARVHWHLCFVRARSCDLAEKTHELSLNTCPQNASGQSGGLTFFSFVRLHVANVEGLNFNSGHLNPVWR